MRQQRVPASVERQAVTYGLGSILDVFRRTNIEQTIGAARLGLFMLGISLFFLWQFLSIAKISTFLAILKEPFAVFSLILYFFIATSLIGLLLVLGWIRLKRFSVVVCEGGLLIAPDSNAESVRWDEIKFYIRSDRRTAGDSEVESKIFYSITRKDGKKFSFSNSDTDGINGLGAAIEEHVNVALLPRMLADYHAGRTLTFGSLTVNAQGLARSDGNTTLSWDDFFDQQVMREDGGVWDIEALHIFQRENRLWCRETVPNIPNILVLQKLIDDACGLKAALAAYDSGSSIHFPPLIINAQGITLNNGQMLPWSPSVYVRMKNQQLQIGTWVMPSRGNQRQMSRFEALAMFTNAETMLEKLSDNMLQAWYTQPSHEILRFYVLKGLLQHIATTRGIHVLLSGVPEQ